MLRKVRPFTMLDDPRLLNLYRLARDLDRLHTPGVIAELGVCNGGSAAAMAAGSKFGRQLWLYDTFEGIPAAGPEDGDLAASYSGSFVGDVRKVEKALSLVGWPGKDVVFRKGTFETTLRQPTPECIALLHIDADWYESVLLALRTLYPLVTAGGVIVLDDFGHWEGTRRAFYQYCEESGLRPLVERRGYTQLHWWKGLQHNRPQPGRARGSDLVR